MVALIKLISCSRVVRRSLLHLSHEHGTPHVHASDGAIFSYSTPNDDSDVAGNAWSGTHTPEAACYQIKARFNSSGVRREGSNGNGTVRSAAIKLKSIIMFRGSIYIYT